MAAAFLNFSNASAEATPITDLASFIAAKNAGGEYRLDADIALTESIGLSKALSIDLNGHKINTNSKTIVVYTDFTVSDSASGGEIHSAEEGVFLIQVGGSANAGKLTLESGAINNTSSYYGGVRVVNGDLVMNGGTISAGDYTVYNSGRTEINGGTIYSSDGLAFQNHRNSELIMNGGTIKTDADYQALNLYGDCKATINDGEILAPFHGTRYDGNGISLFKNTELIINGGRIASYGSAVLGNGSGPESGKSDGTNAKITVNGGKLESVDGVGIYAPQINGVTTITGGEISGVSGIEIRSGALNITGGKLVATAPNYIVTDNINGTTTTGAAVAVAQHVSKQPIDVNICGGTYTGVVAISERNPLGNPETDIEKISISVDKPCRELEFIASGENAVVSEDVKDFIKGGIFSHDLPKEFIDDEYESLDYTNSRFIITKPHDVAVTPVEEGGNVTPSYRRAGNGMVVDLKIEPDDGYQIDSVSVRGESGTEIQLDENYSFAMPNEAVEISVVFASIPAPAPEPTPEPTPTPTPEPDEEAVVTPDTNDNLILNVSILAASVVMLVAAGMIKVKK